MHPDLLRLIGPLLSIALLVVLITRLKLHPFLALILASGFLGLVSGLAPAAVITTFERGFGGMLSTTGLVVGLGSMLGGLLLESGGADRIASAFTSLGPARTIPITMCAAALLIGLPMAAGLYVSHGLLPSHPSPTLAMSVFHADAGRTVMYGLLIALPRPRESWRRLPRRRPASARSCWCWPPARVASCCPT